MDTTRWIAVLDPVRVAGRIEAAYEAGGWPLRVVLIVCLWPLLASTWLVRAMADRSGSSRSGRPPWIAPASPGRSTGLG